MTFRQIADALGVATYPEALDKVYEQENKVNICDLELIDRLQKEYDLFGEYYEDVVRGAKAVAESPLHLAWGSTVATYNMAVTTVPEMTAVPTPESDGTPAGDMMPMLQLIPLVPGSVEEYRRRGFDDKTIYDLLRTYQGGIRTVHKRVGRPGLNRMYYNWNCLYTKAMLFRYGGFNFEVKRMPKKAIYLKNRQDGTMIPVMTGGTYHASGMVLGSAGFENAEGSFEAAFQETDAYFYGHRSVNGFVSAQAEYFQKADWECVLRGGEDMVGVHIPRATDMSDPLWMPPLPALWNSCASTILSTMSRACTAAPGCWIPPLRIW